MIVVRNRTLTEDAFTILKKVQSEISNGKLDIVRRSSSSDIMITCPKHSNGHESRPSCFIRNDDGVGNCFTCGLKGPLQNFIAESMDISISKAEEWLISNFGGDFTHRDIVFPDITIYKNSDIIMDESVLESFENYHPYMSMRKLTPEVISKFQIKYDPKTECLVFPVRDYLGKLRFLTRRSVNNKKFIIDKEANKKYIYLLDNVYRNNYKEVYVVESQINALTLEGWGYHAVALFGAGAPSEQIKELNKTGVNHFILALDNDPAGIKGTKKLCEYIYRNKLVDVVIFNDNRDVNDLSKEEFSSLKQIDRYEFINKNSLQLI